VQILGDHHGNVVHLAERDCTSQRRHQKLLEETPAYKLKPEVRQKLLDAAVQAAKAIGYTSAGTVEGLVSGDDYYFLEMNTRVQVEHPISEMVTGIDIVKEQIRVAAGEPLSFTQEEVIPRGHAIECRINAEDPFKNFMPSPGTVHNYSEPSLPWVRVDSACYTGYKILPFYDSLLAKLVVWGRTREEAIVRTKIALKQFTIEGVSTTIPFHLQLLDDEAFVQGTLYTTYVEKELKARLKAPAPTAVLEVKVESNGKGPHPERTPARNFELEVNQKHFKVSVSELLPDGVAPVAAIATKPAATASAVLPVKRQPRKTAQSQSGEVCSSMHGLVKQVLVGEGDKVTTGQKLLILEAMKMESEILADRDGVVKSLKVKAGETVEANQLMLVIGE
jgi:acetyl-CoA/propionyl-CoA carboxylase, biotin carboxylase, biotin carboxyl carrier protein